MYCGTVFTVEYTCNCKRHVGAVWCESADTVKSMLEEYHKNPIFDLRTLEVRDGIVRPYVLSSMVVDH